MLVCDLISQIYFILFSFQRVVNSLWWKYVEFLNSIHLFKTYIFIFILFSIFFFFLLPLQSSGYGEIPLHQSEMTYSGYLESKIFAMAGSFFARSNVWNSNTLRYKRSNLCNELSIRRGDFFSCTPSFDDAGIFFLTKLNAKAKINQNKKNKNKPNPWVVSQAGLL